jgi:opacity protein-like surface antigen
MKKLRMVVIIPIILFILMFTGQSLDAQGYGGPLTFQGVDQFMLHSAGSRAQGGITVGIRPDVGLMFHNPASLRSLTGIQLSIGGLQQYNDMKQVQEYAPVRHYPNLSLLLEGLTDQIPDTDSTLFGFTPRDTVQRPYDDIGPNWSRSDDKGMPMQVLLAVPITLGDFKIVAGAGLVEYANLNHFYQNNNALSPGVLSQRPLPTFRPTDNNPIMVDWYQTIRSREGSLRGYGLALSGGLEKYNLSFGISGMIISGSSDDYEMELGRGRLTFYANEFRADSVSSQMVMNGTSDFNGQEFTISSMLSSEYVTIGFSVKLPTTITRSFDREIELTAGNAFTSYTESGEDEIKLPWRGTVGLSLKPRQNLLLGIEYEFRPFASTSYVDTGGEETSPWLSASLFRIGLEYLPAPWLALRGGMRGAAEVFEPEGNHIEGEPVTYTVYSAGFGIFIGGAQLNVAYENGLMKYEDIWGSALSRNSDRRHAFVADITYTIPWMR